MWSDIPLPELLSGSLIGLVFLVFQLPVLYAAWRIANLKSYDDWYELITVWGLLYFGLIISLGGVLGICGWFNPEAAFGAALAVGAGAHFFCRRPSPHRLPPRDFSWPELTLLSFALGVMFFQWRTTGLLPMVSTDGLLYHLFYPAVWIQSGFIERIPQPGYVMSSYPCYGELIYGWAMLPVRGDFFAKSFQFPALFLAFTAGVAGARACGFGRIGSLGGAVILGLTGLTFKQALVPGTDTLTGAFFFIGAMLLLVAAARGGRMNFLLAGLAWGISGGVKLLGTMLVPMALVPAAVLFWWLRPGSRRDVVWFLLTTAVCASPYFIVNWAVAGNPVFPCRVGPLFDHCFELDGLWRLGWTREAWGYFVNTGDTALNLPNALVLCLALAAGLAGGVLTPLFSRRRMELRETVLTAVCATAVVLLFAQLKIYPAHTQPRQLIPLAMLSAFGFCEVVRRLEKNVPGAWSQWVAAGATVLTGVLISHRQFDYRVFAGPLAVAVVLTGAVLLALTKVKSMPLRAAILLAAGLFVWLDTGRCFLVCNANASQYRAMLISKDNEAVRQMLDRLTGERSAKIAYAGSFCYNFLGDDYRHELLLLPISASGEKEAWHYRSFEQTTTPGSYAGWLERVRNSGAEYLVVDARSTIYENPPELRWAKEHPEDFKELFSSPGANLFEVLNSAGAAQK